MCGKLKKKCGKRKNNYIAFLFPNLHIFVRILLHTGLQLKVLLDYLYVCECHSQDIWQKKHKKNLVKSFQLHPKRHEIVHR